MRQTGSQLREQNQDSVGQYAEQAERDQGVAFTPKARRLANRLLRRHVRYERFPGKAARLLGVKQAAAEDAEAAEDLRIRELIIAQEKAASAQRADSLVAPGPTLGRRVSAEL